MSVSFQVVEHSDVQEIGKLAQDWQKIGIDLWSRCPDENTKEIFEDLVAISGGVISRIQSGKKSWDKIFVCKNQEQIRALSMVNETMHSWDAIYLITHPHNVDCPENKARRVSGAASAIIKHLVGKKEVSLMTTSSSEAFYAKIGFKAHPMMPYIDYLEKK